MGLMLVRGLCSVKPFLNELFKTQGWRNEILLVMAAYIYNWNFFCFIKISKLKESF